MNFRELVQKSRTFRRFNHKRAVSMAELEELVDLVRYTPSAGNFQPLKFVLSCDPETNELIYSCLGWAAYYKDWNGPEETERPVAYIIMAGDTDIARKIDWDHGIAAQTIMLGAGEKGLGGCILANVNRKKLHREMGLSDNLEIHLVLALGEPAEEVRITEVQADGDIKYFKDGDGVHCVPKRSSDALVVKRYGPDSE